MANFNLERQTGFIETSILTNKDNHSLLGNTKGNQEYSLLVKQGVITDSSLLFYIAEGMQEKLPIDHEKFIQRFKEPTDKPSQNTDSNS